MKKIIAFFAIVAAVIAAVFGILLWRARSQASAAINSYNTAAEDYNGKIAPYNEAAAQTGAENDRLQGVIDAAQGLLDKDADAYEPRTKKDLQKAVDKASKVFVEVPVQIDPFQPQTLVNSFRRADMEVQQIEAQAAEAAVEKAMKTIPEVPEVPDYTEQVEAVEKAQKAYTDSVQMLTNVTAPPDTFVKDRLAKIDTVVQAQAVTKDNDPNGLLGKEDGYTGCVYFLDDRIDRSLLPQEAFEKEQEKKKDKDSDNEKDKGSDNEKEKDKEIEKKKAETEAEESKNASTTASTASSTAVDGDPASTAASTASATAADGDTASATSTTTAAGETAAQAESSSEPESSAPAIDVVLLGTNGGGAVEIFATEEAAKARAQRLAFFTGSVMDAGSVAVEGTCVIRTSNYLDSEAQSKLTDKIREALLSVDPDKEFSGTLHEREDIEAAPAESSNYAPWQHEYQLRGDEDFQAHARRVIETGVTEPSSAGEVYYAGPSDDVQGIINSLGPGDTLYLRGGVYNRKIRLYGGVQGRPDAWITIAAAPGEDVVFDGSGLNGHDQDQSGPSMFWLYGCSYVQLSGFTVRNAHGRDTSAILLEPGTHHVVVSDLYIHNITTPSPKSEDHCANAILLMGRSGSTISNVLLFRNSIENCETGWSEAIAVSANVADVNIVGNRLDDTGNIAICLSGNYGNAPSSVDYPRGALVYGNTITNCHCLYDTGFAIYADGAQNIDFIGNTVKDCDGGIEAGCEHGGHGTRDILIVDNLLTDCAEAAIGIGTPGGGGHTSNVTAYGNRYRHVGWLSGGASILRFGASGVSTYENAYIDDDADMPLPAFPTYENLNVH